MAFILSGSVDAVQSVGVKYFDGDTASKYFPGQAVKSDGDGSVSQANNADQVAGIVSGVSFEKDGEVIEGQKYDANTSNASNIKVAVYNSPNVYFDVPVVDGSNNASTLAKADIGLNIQIAQATAGKANADDADNGISGDAVDSSTKATTATLPFKIVDIKEGGSIAVVKPNNTDFNEGQTGK